MDKTSDIFSRMWIVSSAIPSLSYSLSKYILIIKSIMSGLKLCVKELKTGYHEVLQAPSGFGLIVNLNLKYNACHVLQVLLLNSNL